MIIQSLGEILTCSGKLHYAFFTIDCELMTAVVGYKSYILFW